MITSISHASLSPSQARRQLRESGHSVVVFDYFDTLVVRRIAPEDVKRIASLRLAEWGGIPMDGLSLYALRAALEIRLSEESRLAHGELEFRFSDLADAMHAALLSKGALPPTLINMTAFGMLMERIELSCEFLAQIPDQDMVGAVHDAIASGKAVYVMSDFYLSGEAMKAMLERIGICACELAGVFVSSEQLASKRSGKLYSHVMATEGFDPARAVMVGDNSVADGDNAGAAGWNSIIIDRRSQIARYRKAAGCLRSTREINRRLRRIMEIDPADPHDVFPELSLTFFTLVAMLHATFQREARQDVFFLAREGYYLKRFFDMFQERFAGHGSLRVRTHYLMASRRSVFCASLRPLAEEDFSRIYHQYKTTSIQEFLLSLGFDLRDCEAICAEIDEDPRERKHNLFDSNGYRKLRASARFAHAFEERRSTQKRRLAQYVRDFGVELQDQPFVLVDIGWKGSIQDGLHLALQPQHGTEGHYLGLSLPGGIGPNNKKIGHLFSCLEPNLPWQAVFKECCSLLEIFLPAPHGSTREYLEQDGVIVPKKELDTDEAHFISQHVMPVMDQLSRRFEEISNVFSCHLAPLDTLRRLAAKHHARIVFRPTHSELKWFTKAFHTENFGVFEKTNLAAYGTISSRIRLLYQLTRNPKRFIRGMLWPRAGFTTMELDRLGRLYGFYRTMCIFGVKG